MDQQQYTYMVRKEVRPREKIEILKYLASRPVVLYNSIQEARRGAWDFPPGFFDKCVIVPYEDEETREGKGY